MKKVFLIILSGLFQILFLNSNAFSQGISVDSGLTPARGFWIFRAQVRHMERKSDQAGVDRGMSVYIFPVVLAYGLRSNLTVIMKQTLESREMTMNGMSDKNNGFGDFFIMTKYKAYRKNTREYSFGVAPVIGLNVPIGEKGVSAETWNLKSGIYCSYRQGKTGIDFNFSYLWNGIAGKTDSGIESGNELGLDFTMARQFVLGEKKSTSIVPLVELNYKNNGEDRFSNGNSVNNTGETIFYFSPGIQLIRPNFLIEALSQVPAWQDNNGALLKQNTRFLLGGRLMF